MIRILDFHVHTPHDHSRVRIPDSEYIFILDENLKGHVWSGERPMPSNVKFISLQEAMDLDWKDINLVITHMEPQLLWYHDTVLKKHKPFRPHIHIMHSLPGDSHGEDKRIQWHNDRLSAVKSFVVLNSHSGDWQLSVPHRTIWLGLDESEYQYLWRGGVNRALHVGNNIGARPTVTGYPLLEAVSKSVGVDIVGHNPDLGIRSANSFEDLLSKYYSYDVYFNPTYLSPMPRARIEAMMCGMPLVSTFHPRSDMERFAIDGINGLFSNESSDLINALRRVLSSSDLRQQLSEASRATAVKHFSLSRYIHDWQSVLKEVL